jgi:hypothetical protein
LLVGTDQMMARPHASWLILTPYFGVSTLMFGS